MTLHVVGGQFDERRNTSRTFQPDPGALEAALLACSFLRRSNPDLVRWLEDGHPTMTEAEHRARFGDDYSRKPKRAA